VAFQGYTKMTRYKDCGVLTLQKSMKAKWWLWLYDFLSQNVISDFYLEKTL
jgi:hypothetical protein